MTSSALLIHAFRATSYPNDRGSTVCGFAMLIGSIYLSHANNAEHGRTAIICFIYIFSAGFISSWAIVCRIVCNEVQPTQIRAAASSLGQCANWVVNCVVAFSTPLFLNRSTWGSVLFVRWMFLVERYCMLCVPTGDQRIGSGGN